MRKVFCAILSPVLAALLALPLASIVASAPSGTTTIGIIESPGFPAARPSGPLVRSLPGLKTRSLHDGQGAAPTTAPAVSSASLFLDLLLLRLDPPSYAAPVTGSARQLPAFPTGPPSHS